MTIASRDTFYGMRAVHFSTELAAWQHLSDQHLLCSMNERILQAIQRDANSRLIGLSGIYAALAWGSESKCFKSSQ